MIRPLLRFLALLLTMPRTLETTRRLTLAAAGSLATSVLAGQPANAQAQPANAAACPAAPTTTKDPIRLAMIEGLSGPFANAGEAVWRNLLWAGGACQHQRQCSPAWPRTPAGAAAL